LFYGFPKRTSGYAPIIFIVVLCILCSLHVYANTDIPPPQYIELAKSIVIGKITRITNLPATISPGPRFGYATITVSEVLKGIPVKTVKRKCITWLPPEYASSPHAPTVLNIGDYGIWIIGSDDPMSLEYAQGFTSVERKPEIVRMIKLFAKRRWSKPVNGLRAWAAPIDISTNTNPVVIFQVQNVSKTDILLPDVNTPGCITADVKDGTGNLHFALIPKKEAWNDESRIISPGEVVYLSHIYMETRLTNGMHTVSIACQRGQVTGLSKHVQAKQKILLTWTGKLRAPSVKLVIVQEKRMLTPHKR